MSFVLPTFNLFADVYRVSGVGGTYGAPNVHTPANLTPGRRVFLSLAINTVTSPASMMELLLPPLTDIRAAWNGLNSDIVECPAGSKRFYYVVHVDDIGKGFANEHRLALMVYNVNGNNTLIGGPYAAPVPLP